MRARVYTLGERERERDDLCRLWKYDDTHCAGVDASAGLSLRYALHSVDSTLMLQAAKDTDSIETSTGILHNRHS